MERQLIMKCLAARAMTHTMAGMLMLTLLVATTPTTADTLSDTLNRGTIRCGVSENLPGFSKQNSLGEFSGFDVDICRAVSSAVFGNPDRVEYVRVSKQARLDGLVAERYDILSHNNTWTLTANVQSGQFAGVSFYDGQGFIVNKLSGIRSALELDNKPICVSRDTSSELNAADFFLESELRYRPVYAANESAANAAYGRGDCVALTANRSTLAAIRANFETPDAHLLLPEVISKEPLGPMVRHNDTNWENITRWTLACLINAEELGVTKDTVVQQSTASASPSIQRLLGQNGNAGVRLGLDIRWCAQIISNVGNYGEIYEQHIGPETIVGLERGINSLWTNGGLLYAPPVR